MLTIPLIKKQLADIHMDDITSLTSECNVFRNVISRNFKSNCDVGDIYIFMKNNYSMAMAYVDSPRRKRSTSARESALTHLFFEKDLVSKITFEEFSKEWLKKPRSLLF